MHDAEFFDANSKKYEDAFAHDQGLLDFIQTIISRLPPNARVLDIGCGTGKPVSTSLADTGHSVIGIDLSPGMVEHSRKAVPNGTFKVADMTKYEPEEKFDAILNILCLFQLNREQIEYMAVRWSQWVKPGGMLCICTMAAEDVDPEGKGKGYDADGWCARDVLFKFMGERDGMTVFTRVGWKGLLERNGFNIIETTTQVHVPPKEADSDAEPHFFVIAKKAE